MLEFELWTTAKPVVVEPIKGINVRWPTGMEWEDYVKQLVPVGTLCVGTHDPHILNSIKGDGAFPVTLVVGHKKPSVCIIMCGEHKVQPYSLVTFYVQHKTTIIQPKNWEREGDGVVNRPCTPEELKALNSNDRFLSLLEKWRQETQSVVRPIGLGEVEVEVSGESGTED